MTVKQSIAAITAAAAIGGGVYEGTVSDGPVNVVREGELVSQRTETAVVYDAGNGKRRAEVHTQPVHWFDASDRDWKTIDTAVKAKPILRQLVSSRDYETTAGPYTADYETEKPYNYRLVAGGASVAYTALFDTTKAVTVTVEPTTTGVKETVILADETAPTRLDWTVETDAVFKARGDGGFTADGLIIETPVAWDAGGAAVPVTASLDKGTYTLTVDVKGAVFPVTVDPSTMITAGTDANSRIYNTNATYLTGRNLSTATGVATNGRVGQLAPGAVYGIYRVPVKFAIPPLTTAQLCTLYVYGNADESTTDFNVNVYGARAWRPTIDTGDVDAFDGWQASGAYTGTILNNTWSTASYQAGWNSIVFNAAGKDSVEASASDTLAVMLLSSRDVSATQPSGNEYIDVSGLGDANKPKLAIWYDIAPPTSPGAVTVTPLSATSTSIAWTGDTSDADSVRVLSLTGTAPDTTVIGYVAKTGSPATFTIPSGTTYYRLVLQAVNILKQATNSTNWDDHWWYNVTYSRDLPLQSYKTHKGDTSATYADVRITTDQGYITSTAADSLGQWKDGANNYHIYRQSFFVPLPPSNLVSAASIVVTGAADQSATDFTITAVEGVWNGGTTDDYRYVYAAADTTKRYGTLTTAGFNAAGADSLVFDAAGRAAVLSASNDTLFVTLFSNRDIAATQPTGAEYVVINPAGAVLRVTWRLNSTKPTGLSLTAISKDSVAVAWTDNSLDETGFTIVRTSDGGTVASVAAGVTTARIGGLATNTLYSWRIKVVGGVCADSLSVADSTYTKAAAPVAAPTLTFLTGTTAVVVIDTTGTGNPSYTEYAIQDSLSGLYVDADGDSLRAAADWLTYGAWGGAAGDTLAVLTGKKYTIRVKARSGQ